MSNKEQNMNEAVNLANEAHMPFYDTANRVARSSIAVIDTMVQRGAVKGEELSALGQLRDNCVQVIQMAETYHQDQAAQ